MARGSCQIVFVFICSEKCQASSLPSMECRVSRSKEKEKTEILRVYSLSLGGLIAIPKMNVAVGTGWRVCWQSLEMRGRKGKKKGFAVIFLCEKGSCGDESKRTMSEILTNMRDTCTHHWISVSQGNYIELWIIFLCQDRILLRRLIFMWNKNWLRLSSEVDLLIV
jgi:hypothetical protein